MTRSAEDKGRRWRFRWLRRTQNLAAAGGRAGAGRRAGPADRSATAGGSPPPGPQVLRSGRFRSLEHATTGTAIVARLPDGRLFLRLERLSTSNGPDVRVYLSHVP